MSRQTYARVAGFMFLFYIATALPETILFSQATAGDGAAAKLASLAEHAPRLRWVLILSLLTIANALVLALALYAITRDEEPHLALLALAFRIAEGVINALATVATSALFRLGEGGGWAAALDPEAAGALGALLVEVRSNTTLVSATAFAVGSTIYAYLFLRARSIPVPLAWLGVVASVLLVVLLPAQLAGVLEGSVTELMWIPMLVFEVALSLWLLVKGIGPARAKPV